MLRGLPHTQHWLPINHFSKRHLMYTDDSVPFQFLNQHVTWQQIKHFTNIKCHISLKSQTCSLKTSHSPEKRSISQNLCWVKLLNEELQIYSTVHSQPAMLLCTKLTCLTDLVILCIFVLLCLTSFKQFLTYFLIHIHLFSLLPPPPLHFCSLFYFSFCLNKHTLNNSIIAISNTLHIFSSTSSKSVLVLLPKAAANELWERNVLFPR